MRNPWEVENFFRKYWPDQTDASAKFVDIDAYCQKAATSSTFHSTWCGTQPALFKEYKIRLFYALKTDRPSCMPQLHYRYAGKRWQSNLLFRWSNVRRLEAFFFSVRTTNTSYLDMLEQCVLSQLLHQVVFHQAGAPLHFSHIVGNHSDTEMQVRWFHRSLQTALPPRSSDSMPMYIFSWGYVKITYPLPGKDKRHSVSENSHKRCYLWLQWCWTHLKRHGTGPTILSRHLPRHEGCPHWNLSKPLC